MNCIVCRTENIGFFCSTVYGIMMLLFAGNILRSFYVGEGHRNPGNQVCFAKSAAGHGVNSSD